MSHSHRDEHDLAEPVVEEPAPVVVVVPAPVTSNSEAERRAAERRKAEGLAEQTTEHQFTGDLPEPSRGGTDVETRLFGGDGDEDGDESSRPSAASRRGPPPPRMLQVEDEGSWAAPPALEALGASALAGAELTRSWMRPSGGE